MEANKKEFIEFLFSSGAISLGDFTLKSGRPSPWFVNIGEIKDGEKIHSLGKSFASVIKSLDKKVDVVFGPAYKGIPISVTTAIALKELGDNVGFAFDRKERKGHGEDTGASLQKAMLVGSKLKDGDNIVMVEDVFTTGDTKYAALELLNKMANNLEFSALMIAVDRQEVGIDGKSAIQQFIEKTQIPILSAVNACDVLDFFSEKGFLSREDSEGVERMKNYLRVYGSEEARRKVGKINQVIIKTDKSVIPACDVQTIEEFENIIRETANVEGVGGYKIGFELASNYSLPKIVEIVRRYTTKPVIYDHQKAGTDIPATGKNFARVCKNAGVDAIILFPQAGPETERAWIYYALNAGLNVIVGGRMTHPAYSQSEGGFISDEGALEIYKIAARAGINNFVVPGNKPEVIEKVKKIVEEEGIKPVFFAPGFVAQGGKIADATQVAGNEWHAIVGRGIYSEEKRGDKTIKEAAQEYTSQL